MSALRVLVTGASGFIGRALTERLIAEGHSVTALGRNVARLPAGAAPLFAASLDDEALVGALGTQRFDSVYHLAAYGVAPDQRDADTMFAVNVAGTAAIVRAARRAGARAVVYAGSSAEYREARHGTRIDENHPLARTGLYGTSKAAGGLWGGALAAREGVAFQWLRIFGVFGPGEAAHRLLPAIADKLARGQAVDLSPGDQIRDFLYVDDAVAGLVRAGEVALRGPGGCYNLCSGVPVSVKDVALAMADAMGRPRDLLRFGALAYRPDENLWLCGNGDALREAAGFVPSLGLREAIGRFLAARTPHSDMPTHGENRP